VVLNIAFKQETGIQADKGPSFYKFYNGNLAYLKTKAEKLGETNVRWVAACKLFICRELEICIASCANQRQVQTAEMLRYFF
jgi:hypothetical protein